MESAEWRKIQGSVSSAAVRHQFIKLNIASRRNYLVFSRLTGTKTNVVLNGRPIE